MTDAVRHAVAELAGDLHAWLEYAQETGAEYLPWEPPAPRQADAPRAQRQPRPTQTRPQIQPPAPRAQGGPRAASQGEALDAIRAELGDCRRCGLHQGRRNIVFGVGNPNADLVVVGEAPGRDEDLSGEPFVGRSGQLLTRMLAAIGMNREDAYICKFCPYRAAQS